MLSSLCLSLCLSFDEPLFWIIALSNWEKAQTWRDPNHIPPFDSENLTSHLCHNAKLYKMLGKGTPLCTRVGAKGVVHCGLTIMLYLLTMLGILRMGRHREFFVSSALVFLMRLLEYFFSGSHHTIWLCALPALLDLTIIENMVSKFRGQLRDDRWAFCAHDVYKNAYSTFQWLHWFSHIFYEWLWSLWYWTQETLYVSMDTVIYIWLI